MSDLSHTEQARQRQARRALGVGDLPTAVLLLVQQLAEEQGVNPHGGVTAEIVRREREGQ